MIRINQSLSSHATYFPIFVQDENRSVFEVKEREVELMHCRTCLPHISVILHGQPTGEGAIQERIQPHLGRAHHQSVPQVFPLRKSRQLIKVLVTDKGSTSSTQRAEQTCLQRVHHQSLLRVFLLRKNSDLIKFLREIPDHARVCKLNLLYQFCPTCVGKTTICPQSRSWIRGLEGKGKITNIQALYVRWECIPCTL